MDDHIYDDTTTLHNKRYIEMCEMAEDIQSIWSRMKHDWFIDARGVCQIVSCPDCFTNVTPDSDAVWLPTQCQLQGMIAIFENDSITIDIESPRRGLPLLMFLNWFMAKCYFPFYIQKEELRMDTLEQIWLCAVMFERFNKLWDGERWTLVEEKPEPLIIPGMAVCPHCDRKFDSETYSHIVGKDICPNCNGNITEGPNKVLECENNET